MKGGVREEKKKEKRTLARALFTLMKREKKKQHAILREGKKEKRGEARDS